MFLFIIYITKTTSSCLYPNECIEGCLYATNQTHSQRQRSEQGLQQSQTSARFDDCCQRYQMLMDTIAQES